MRKLITIITICLAGITLTWFYFKDKTTQINISKQPPKVQKLNKTRTVKQIDNKEIKKPYLSQLKQAQKNHQEVFNQDPAIDSVLLSMNYNKCIAFLNDLEDEFGMASYKVFNNRTISQNKYKKKHEKYCQQLEQDHPEYLLTQKKQLRLLKKGLNKKDAVGKILSGFYNKKSTNFQDLDIAQAIDALKATNPNLLLHVNRYFRKYINDFIYPNVIKLIHGQQKSYILSVINYANYKYACNQGARCDEFSEVVARLCIDNNLCGKSFNEIMEKKISEGMSLDINIVYDYLKGIYLVSN